jgi:hypothetical protein
MDVLDALAPPLFAFVQTGAANLYADTFQSPVGGLDDCIFSFRTFPAILNTVRDPFGSDNMNFVPRSRRNNPVNLGCAESLRR